MGHWKAILRMFGAAAVVVVLAAACSNPLYTGDTTLIDDSAGRQLDLESTASGAVLPSVPEHQQNDTMYQFFYWDAYPGLWGDVTDSSTQMHGIAQDIADAGVTMVWLPPAAKGFSGTYSVGYDVYDFWDLGEFDQKGTVATRYGTRDQLQSALSLFNELGIKANYDVVFNHRMGADSKENVDGFGEVWSYFDLQGRDTYYTPGRWGGLYHDFDWNWTAFNGIDNQLFPGKWWGDTYHFPYLMGNDVDYNRSDLVDEMKAWGEWIINDVGFSGYRMDAIAHVDSDFTRDWINHVQASTPGDTFFVAEAWVSDIAGYLDYVGTPHLNAFDFGLRDDFVNLSSGSKDMRWWGGLVNSNRASQAVTFVDNHDTSREGNPYGMPQVTNYKNQAYAYILTRAEGVPTVFARDWEEFGMASSLSKLVEARKYYAYGPGHESAANTEAVYAYVREGLDDVPGTGLVMLISGRDWGGQQTYSIDSRQPNTEFFDYTGNVDGTITTDGSGYADFPVNVTESSGWSVWVPVDGSGDDGGDNGDDGDDSGDGDEDSDGWQQAYFRGTPNGWDTSDMTEAEPGVWTITADFTGQDDPRFKVDRYGDWTENYPERDYTIDEAGSYLITFDESTADITAELQTDDNGDGSDDGDSGEGDDQSGQITLRVTVDVGSGNSVFFTGSAAELSNWGTGTQGTWTNGNVWEVTINDPGTFEWKTRIGPTGGEGQGWESGGNHNQDNLHPAHQGW